MTDKKLYFIRRADGREIGPFAEVYLPKLVETGNLTRTDQIRPTGSMSWAPAESQAGLFKPEADPLT